MDTLEAFVTHAWALRYYLRAGAPTICYKICDICVGWLGPNQPNQWNSRLSGPGHSRYRISCKYQRQGSLTKGNAQRSAHFTDNRQVGY
jgi:hypothetical protein